MKKLLFALVCIAAVCSSARATSETYPHNPYELAFQDAYQAHPDIPKGLLHAVAWHQTRFQDISSHETASCIGVPAVRGVMGLTPDGKNYFNNNADFVSLVSGYNMQDVLGRPAAQVESYAEAFDLFIHSAADAQDIANTLLQFSELPAGNAVNEFARQSFLYSVFTFLNDPIAANTYQFSVHHYDLEKLFGKENLSILSATTVSISKGNVATPNGKKFTSGYLKSNDYGPAIWNPAPSCNYSSRAGTAVSAITIHTIQGSYAGAISWAQNCNSNVSYHYVIRSSDGQITQMVDEVDKAWHVGSANPYTIGYEHEGYVSDPSWYTTAMYNASADLSRDITQSGYGIQPLRTYFGASSSGTNTLGACTHIKGHQHYPNQSHTDPGINWDWERYYKLINNSPTINTVSAGSGTFYDSGGSAGNYSDDERELTLIAPSGATSVTVTFSAFDLENNWDYLYIYDGSTTNDPLLGIYTGTGSPGTVTGNNGALLMEFRSDCATTATGWAATWNSNSSTNNDVTAPTTSISSPPLWVTADFTSNFTDADETGGSGLDQSFYQVIVFDGIEWRANANNGFFSDNFDVAIHPDWTDSSGSWSINNAVLQQSDESNTNTNLFAALDQTHSTQHLYHWAGMIDGSGSNRRAGFHFYSDDGSLPNRGNSYFVWFRLDDQKIQFYETINDVFSLESDLPYNFTAGQWYDFKVTYDEQTGIINIYIDNQLAATWTDPTPLTNGQFISFRSGNAVYEVNNLKVYRSRPSSVTVSVGTANDDIYLQNLDPLTHAAKVKSIVSDSAGNLSAISQQLVNVDWTPPTDITTVNDGLGADLDNTTTNTELSANWSSSSDNQSDLARYWYAIGSTAGATDIVNWTDNWFSDTMVHTGLNLTVGQTYYVSVKSENGAGLQSNVTTSDGILIDQPTAIPTANFNYSNTYICNGDSIWLTNSSTNAISYQWNLPGGTPSSSTQPNPFVLYPASGSYTIELIANGPGGSDTVSQVLNVNVEQPPLAALTVSTDTVYLPNGTVFFTNTSSNANGFAWNFGDGGTSTDASPWHDFTAAGIYEVQLVAINGNCPNDTATQTIVVLNSNSIGDVSSSIKIDVFPVPADQSVQLQIQLTENSSVQIRLLDATGRLVKTFSEETITAGMQTQTLPLSDVANGSYFLQVSGPDWNRVLPLIVSRP